MSRDSADNKIITVADLYDDWTPRIKRLEIMVAVLIFGGIWDTMGRPTPTSIESVQALIGLVF